RASVSATGPPRNNRRLRHSSEKLWQNVVYAMGGSAAPSNLRCSGADWDASSVASNLQSADFASVEVKPKAISNVTAATAAKIDFLRMLSLPRWDAEKLKARF